MDFKRLGKSLIGYMEDYGQEIYTQSAQDPDKERRLGLTTYALKPLTKIKLKFVY